MKKLKSIFTLALAFSFLAAVTFTSCGGKKEERSETETEQVESEHPDGGEHPAVPHNPGVTSHGTNFITCSATSPK